MASKKKIICGVLAVGFGLTFIGIVLVAVSLNSIAKSGVETYGPKMTRTAFTIESVDIQPMTGAATIDGLWVGNPDGYATEFAVKIGSVLLDIQPETLWSDKVIVESIRIDSPEITFEGGQAENNLGTLLKNITDYVGAIDEDDRALQKFQVNHFQLTGAKVHLRLAIFGDQTVTLTAPEIELHDLGKGPEGVTSAELTQLVIKRISSEIGAMATTALAELGRASTGSAPERASVTLRRSR